MSERRYPHRTKIVTVYSNGTPMNQAYCDCGWTGLKRFYRAFALGDADRHCINEGQYNTRHEQD